MTLADLEKLSDQELNKLAAERVIGWEFVKAPPICGFSYAHWTDKRSVWVELTKWNPAADIADAFTLQAEIERMELRESFTSILQTVTERPRAGLAYQWFLINATARQRTEAAILAVEEA